ncbi:MAG: bi-domain-containing oxidoreductase [Magnetospirillum sp. WYHS-4]
MKQIIQSARTGKLALRQVPDPKVKGGHLLVRTRASLISAGTERMVVEFARKSLVGKAQARPDLVRKVLDKAKRDGIAATLKAVLARLDEPLPLGYSAAGEVVAVGAGLEGVFRVGDRVAVAGAGLANHAELNVVPRNLATRIPAGVAYEEACFGTLGAIALHSVRNLEAGLGDVVAVIGVGLLGQLAVQFLALQGCRAVVLDYNPDRLALAKRLGAEAGLALNEPGLEEAVRGLTGGLGCDRVLIAAATESSEPFEVAALVARDRAKVAMVGMTGTAFPYAAFMKKELSLVVSRSYGPGRYDPDYEGRGVKYPEGWVRWTETENLAETVRLMAGPAGRRLDVGALTTHTYALDEAEAAYALVTEGKEPHLGVVLAYAGEPPRPAIARPASARPVLPAGRCVLGVIGAGNFARTVLLPELKRLPGVELHTLATQRGATSDHGRQTFGFRHGVADEAEVLDNPEINAVLIATRHDSHAALTARALAAGKNVLVEKPLALSLEEVNRVAEARNGSAAFFQVGFNRRFAPLAVKMRDGLAKASGPKFLTIRVNAGHVPPESWVHADEGGGRVLGEVCHFVDLARFFVGVPIVSVQADAAQAIRGGADDVAATLRFADGSLATLAYTGLGDSAYSKERYEAFAGGAVLALDNFRSLRVTENGRSHVGKAQVQDKGFQGSLAAFVKAVAEGGAAPIDEAELVETATATVLVMESLRRGERMDM